MPMVFNQDFSWAISASVNGLFSSQFSANLIVSNCPSTATSTGGNILAPVTVHKHRQAQNHRYSFCRSHQCGWQFFKAM